VTPGAGDGARESPDGKWLYYQKGWPPPVSLWRMPVEGGGEAKVLDGVADWTLGPAGVYFIAPRDPRGRSNICLQEFAGGRVRTVATTDRPLSLGMAVSPDGRTLLYSQFDEFGRDLMLVENFR
jgi:hypothetical protein